MSLKQVIVVFEDQPKDAQMLEAIAKAPLSLVTRCFDGSKNFLGRHEANTYQKTILEWMDTGTVTEIKTTNEEDARAYFWTAEMMGVPCDIVSVQTGPSIGDTTAKCVVFGPTEENAINEIIGQLPEYTNSK